MHANQIWKSVISFKENTELYLKSRNKFSLKLLLQIALIAMIILLFGYLIELRWEKGKHLFIYLFIYLLFWSL